MFVRRPMLALIEARLGNKVVVRGEIVEFGYSLVCVRWPDSLRNRLPSFALTLSYWTPGVSRGLYHCTSSTRRFFARPSSASLDAIGE